MRLVPRTPHDYTDLFLAPVALAVDQRLEEFAALDRGALHRRVSLETDRSARTAAQRGADVVASVTYLLDLHGWRASWDPRGLRLSHDEHSLVLGIPSAVAAYVAELPET
jgi:hypothetical protein